MPFDQRADLFVRHAAHDGWTGDLVAVQMKDRQHRAIARRIEEGNPLPSRRQGTGFRLPIADYCHHQQVRVVERRAEGVAQHVAKLAAFMDRTGVGTLT